MYRKRVRRNPSFRGRYSIDRQQPGTNIKQLISIGITAREVLNGTKHRKNRIHDVTRRKPMVLK